LLLQYGFFPLYAPAMKNNFVVKNKNFEGKKCNEMNKDDGLLRMNFFASFFWSSGY
jgi:hypothetical protein